MKGDPDDYRAVIIIGIFAALVLLLAIIAGEVWVALETGKEHWSP